jgi:hypothetical protein
MITAFSPRATIALRTILTTILVFAAFVTVGETRCRWVWNGARSELVCDEERGPELCELSQDRTRHNLPRTRSVFCRPDGSKWRVVIVRPDRITVRTFDRRGNVVNKEHYRLSDRERRRGDRGRRSGPPPPPDRAWNAREFSARVVGASVKGRIERKGERLKGVIHVDQWLGDANTYHFKGRVSGRTITVRHDSGHSFQGRATRGGFIAGVLTTKKGLRIPVKIRASLPPA